MAEIQTTTHKDVSEAVLASSDGNKLPTNSIKELASDPAMQEKRERAAAVEASLPKPQPQELVPGKPDIPQDLIQPTYESAEKYNETMIGKLVQNLNDSKDPKAIELARKLDEDWANRDKLAADYEKANGPGSGKFFPGKGRLCCCKSDGEKAQNYRAWLGTSEHSKQAQCHGTNLIHYFPPTTKS